ncbi:MAG TPA: type VI secretion system-associated FHA domain protein TagH [Planctomycetota bacterium]
MTAAVRLRVTMVGSDETVLSEHPIVKDVLAIGRVMGNDVVLPDVEKRVSSKHARIERNGPAWRIVDLGSTNGTYLNDRRLEAQAPTPLKNGDLISIGLFHLRFLQEEVLDGTDRTVVAVDLPRKTAALAEELTALWARTSTEAPETRQEALLRTLEAAVAGLPPEAARTILSQTQSRFRPGESAAPVVERGTVVRRRDAEIQKREEMYQAGQRALADLSQKLIGDERFESAEQMERFAKLIHQTLELMLDWVTKSLKGRKEFEDQFSADLTMVFGKQANPLKSSDAADMAKFLLDWRNTRSPQQARAALDEAFKDLTMHQIGMLAGVQESLSAVLRRLDPKSVEAEVKGAGLFSSMAKKAWDRYAEIYAEIFAENSRLFNEMIYPNVRKGYLATHSEPLEGTGGGATPKLEGPKK